MTPDAEQGGGEEGGEEATAQSRYDMRRGAGRESRRVGEDPSRGVKLKQAGMEMTADGPI